LVVTGRVLKAPHQITPHRVTPISYLGRDTAPVGYFVRDGHVGVLAL